MPAPLLFDPAERLPRSQILGQARQIGDCPILITMLDTTRGMVALLNPQRQIVFCNDACVEAAGLSSRGEALCMRPGELLHCIHAAEKPEGCGASDSCHHCGLAHSLAAGTRGAPTTGECLLQCHADGKETSAEYAVKVKPLPHLGDGWQVYSLDDISGEKRRDALERTFFHDIMNRASAVAGVSSILAEDELSPADRSDFISLLALSAHAMVEEIRSQRTLVAAEKGHLAVVASPCDSLRELQAAVATCLPFGSAEDKHVAILPSAESVAFSTDPSLLGRVLLNLIKNAIEASLASSVVTATCITPAPGRIRFSIHNDTAMSAHVRAHVFHRSFSTKGAGGGLGTYSIKLLTESYLGGRTWFESASGPGTTFHAEFAV